MNYAYAAGIGAVTGLRSMTGPASVARLVGSPTSVHATTLLAIGELIADKLPFMPSRTDPPSLGFRAVSGAVCGYLVCRRRGSKQQAIVGAVIGGAAAVATAYLGRQYRRQMKVPDFVAALLEDAVAVGSGSAVVQRA